MISYLSTVSTCVDKLLSTRKPASHAGCSLVSTCLWGGMSPFLSLQVEEGGGFLSTYIVKPSNHAGSRVDKFTSTLVDRTKFVDISHKKLFEQTHAMKLLLYPFALALLFALLALYLALSTMALIGDGIAWARDGVGHVMDELGRWGGIAAMSKYATDKYLVVQFDRLGAKTQTLTADSFLDAQDQGRVAIGQAVAHSFAVLRVLYNSATPQLERYDFKTRWGER